MGARFRSWWQQIKQRRVTILVVTIILVVAVALIIIVVRFYGTGFNGYKLETTAQTISGPSAGTVVRTEVTQPGKTLWDWLQLLIIPAVLAVAGYVINLTISRGEQAATEQRDKTERYIAIDRKYDETYKEYVDKISELLLHEHLRESKVDDEVRKIAGMWTALTLTRLDANRKKHLIEFLWYSKLIESDNVIDLNMMNLTRADLSRMNLSGLNFSGANMSEVDFTNSDLTNTNLTNTMLPYANLTDALVTAEQLAKASSLQGATMPDGSIHP